MLFKAGDVLNINFNMTRLHTQKSINFSYYLSYLVISLLCLYQGESVKSVDDFQLSNVKANGWTDKILDSLEKAVQFYSSNIEKVNLDSVFGLRVGQGGLNKAITESKLDKRNVLFNRLVDIHSSIVKIAERGFLKLESMDSSYFHKFKHLIDGKWFSIMPYHSVDLSLVHKVTLHDDDSFDESASDNCMTGLIGSQSDGVKEPCQISDECWDLMTKKGADSYYLTHQGLFLLLAENRGCRARVLQKFGNDEEWQHKSRYLGANIYHQLLKTFQEKKTADNEIGKDLFAEQVIVCQMLGVVQCFDTKFLSVILELQDPSGCWKQKNQDEGNDAREVTGIPIKKEEEEDTKIVRFHNRKLKEELVLQDGCSAHFTGVATGCLGMFAYWFASHPDSLMGAEDQSNKKDLSEALHFSQTKFMGTDNIFIVFRCIVIFVVVAFGFYYLRRFRRRVGPIFRKYKGLNSV